MNDDIELRSTTQVINVDESKSVTVTLGGPPGPTGAAGTGGGSSVDVDARIAAHDQQEQAHTNATSGRDFSALFLNGLV